MARRTAPAAPVNMLPLPRVAHKRASYDERTGRCTRVAKIAAKAMMEEIPFVETDDGFRVRVWKKEEMQRYGNPQIIEAIRLKAAVEAEEMLEFVPPPAIKYCVTKGWLVKQPGGFYRVTRKAAAELELPRKLRGRAINFLDTGL